MPIEDIHGHGEFWPVILHSGPNDAFCTSSSENSQNARNGISADMYMIWKGIFIIFKFKAMDFFL